MQKNENNIGILLLDRYEKIDDNGWLDKKTGKIFSHLQHRNLKYRMPDGNVVSAGKDFHYLDLAKDYLDGPQGIKYFKQLYSRIGIQQESEIISNTEVIYQTNCKLPLKGKTVLIIGAGPSTNSTNWKILEYDYVFTCNNFLKNKKVENEKPYFISLAANVDFDDVSLQQYFDNNKCIIGLEPEHLKPAEIAQFKRLFDKHKDKICIYQTRYCSAMGIGSRQIIFAILMGAKKIYFCGHDQYHLEDEIAAHAYEERKRLPRWRASFGKTFQDKQLVILTDYIAKLKKIYDFEIYNLAEDQECCAWSFATKEIFPLSEKIKELIR